MNKLSSPLVRLFGNGKQLLYDRGDTVLRAGDTPSGVYLITAGWVKVYSLCHDGEPNIIISLRPGDVFPLPWALTETIRDVNFAALEATTLLRISREVFLQGIATDSKASQAVYLGLVRHFLHLENELDNLHYRSARERVAFRILTLADSFGQHKANRVILGVRVPNEYIARSSNMTRETASREISWLARKGLIRNIKGYLVIMDAEALKAEAEHGLARRR